MKSNLNRNLLIGFSISLLILVISSAASFLSIKNLLKSGDMVAHTNEVVQELQELLSEVKDAETGQRGFLLTGINDFLDPYVGSFEKVQIRIKTLKELTSDNELQLERVEQLNGVIKKRFSNLQSRIDEKRNGKSFDLNSLYEGKLAMDSVRAIIKNMNDREQSLLKARTIELNKFSSYTPVLIIVAAMLAVFITIIFYIKVKRDLADKSKLQDQLIQKDLNIQERIKLINQIASKISDGDYSIRVEKEEYDSLGDISTSLNKMASSLQLSFQELENREWLQSGVAQLNNSMIGDHDLYDLSNKVVEFTANYTNSQVGALYIIQSEKEFEFQSGFGLDVGRIKKSFKIGEGLNGACAATGKMIVINDIPEDAIIISSSALKIKPVNIVLFPIIFESQVKAIVEIGSLYKYSQRELDFFKIIGENIGISINTVQSKRKLQELLEETQSQAEELMSQQAEMEHANVELETQAQQLQTSEEELKVQSEELAETNTLLEERAALLAQQNELIIQKNTEIQKRSEDLAQSTKYKSEFLANMSHELRTPLNSILLLSRLMSENTEQNLTADQVQYANVIQSSGNGLLQLIDEILDLSKIEAGKMTIEVLPLKVDDIVKDINGLFEPIANQNKVSFVNNVDENVPAQIETDKLRLEQILKNLLSNAFKFTENGKVEFSISPTKNKPEFISFTVKDTGIGINAEKLDIIFEAFQQEDGSTRRKFGGTGLGLSISKEIAKLLGGDISVKSVIGEGSEFVLSIPAIANFEVEESELFEESSINKEVLVKEEIKEISILDQRYQTSFIPEEIEDDRNAIKKGDKLLLIVEDDTNFAKALLDYARQKGYKAVVAVRGDVGIEMASTYKPLGILLDIQLPVKNGWQVLEALKNNPTTRHIPVHIMSSYEVKKESLLKGAIDFINKPVAFEQLNTIFDKIEFVLSKKDKKVLIIEENYKHAKALAYYLSTYNVQTAINQTIQDSIQSLKKDDIHCAILDIGASDTNYETLLEKVKKSEGLENLPVILFTGKSISMPEEFKLRKYADAIVLKTANSYQRILDEVTLFLHLVQEQQTGNGSQNFEKSMIKESVLNGKTVLLADDDVRNIFSMTKVLEKYGLNIIPAMDGKEAIDLLNANPDVDIVLMDIMMPEMDGYESIKAIRKKRSFKNLPVIAVTAKAMNGDREKCIAAGASDYISKPVDMDQLVSLLRIWLYEKAY